jgi:hypothetical protein
MKRLLLCVCAVWLVAAGTACHADPEDAAGQANELSDPARRPNAIQNIKRLWQRALEQSESNRSDARVQAILDATAEKLSQCYVDNPTDSTSGEEILLLLEEMKDPRTIPALIAALDWRPGTENHAQSAAKALRGMEVPADKRGEVVAALGAAYEKISQARGIDNRMRREFIVTLGALGDERGQPILMRIMTRQTDSQDFLFNRLAAQELGKIAGPDQVNDFVKALFMFDERRPQVQLEDVARAALVRIGRPAVEPTVALLRGQNQEANALATAMIEAGRRAGGLSEDVTMERLVVARAAATLGSLGYAEGYPALLQMTKEDADEDRKWNAGVAMMELNLTAEQRAEARDALVALYGAVELPRKPRIIAALRQSYDPLALPFFFEQASDADVDANVRIEAVKAFALLANAEEATRLRTMIQADTASEEGGYRSHFEEMNPALEVAGECNVDVACWVRKLEDSNKLVIIKASYMLARLGAGNQQALDALVPKLGHSDIEVRFSVLKAIDAIATQGSEAAVTKIDELQEREDGTSIWNQFATQALPVQSRLRNRGGQS